MWNVRANGPRMGKAGAKVLAGTGWEFRSDNGHSNGSVELGVVWCINLIENRALLAYRSLLKAKDLLKSLWV